MIPLRYDFWDERVKLQQTDRQKEDSCSFVLVKLHNGYMRFKFFSKCKSSVQYM